MIFSVKTALSLLQLFCHSTLLSQTTDIRYMMVCYKNAGQFGLVWFRHENWLVLWISSGNYILQRQSMTLAVHLASLWSWVMSLCCPSHYCKLVYVQWAAAAPCGCSEVASRGMARSRHPTIRTAIHKVLISATSFTVVTASVYRSRLLTSTYTTRRKNPPSPSS